MPRYQSIITDSTRDSLTHSTLTHSLIDHSETPRIQFLQSICIVCPRSQRQTSTQMQACLRIWGRVFVNAQAENGAVNYCIARAVWP